MKHYFIALLLHLPIWIYAQEVKHVVDRKLILFLPSDFTAMSAEQIADTYAVPP